jgi:sulfide dehydrogenase cytochrome subunit
MKRYFKVLLIGLGTVTGSVCSLGMMNTAHAQALFDVSILAESCANCHGTDGRSPGGIPSLAGRPAAVLKAQMLAYQSESPPAGTTIMNRLAKGYNDAEVEALAEHFSKIAPDAPVSDVIAPSVTAPLKEQR